MRLLHACENFMFYQLSVVVISINHCTDQKVIHQIWMCETYLSEVMGCS